MKINKVVDYYYKAYNKAAKGKEFGRPTINVFKGLINTKRNNLFYEEFKKIITRLISGFFYWPNTFPTAVDEATAYFLYSLIRLIQPDVVIEIGTAKGNSAISIGQALKDNGRGKLYTMDPNEHDIVNIAIKKSHLKKYINYIIDYSNNVIPKLNLIKADLVFIDGDHSYESVKKDFDLVKNLIPSGGIVIFHDSIWFEGPRRVIKEIKESGQYAVITFPTLVGTDERNEVTLNNEIKNFKPVGISVCYKL